MRRNLLRNRKGQGLVEYALIIAGVALVAVAGISMFGHKVSDLISTVAVVLPGAHAEGNAPIASGKLIETTQDGGGNIVLDVNSGEGVIDNSDTERLSQNLWGADYGEALTPDPGSGTP